VVATRLGSGLIAGKTGLKQSAWFNRGGNAYFIRRPWLKKVVPTPHEGESVYNACGLPLFFDDDYVPPEQTIDRLRSCFESMRKNAGGKILVSKRTANNRRLKQLARIFPSARYVRLLRDGREVAQSLSLVEWWNSHKLWWANCTPLELEQQGEDRLAICARNWVHEINEIEQGLKYIDPARVLDVRFADLLNEPVDNLNRIAAFLGLGFPEEYGQALESLHMSYTPNKWAKSWTPEQQATVLREQKSLLAKLGFIES